MDWEGLQEKIERRRAPLDPRRQKESGKRMCLSACDNLKGGMVIADGERYKVLPSRWLALGVHVPMEMPKVAKKSRKGSEGLLSMGRIREGHTEGAV